MSKYHHPGSLAGKQDQVTGLQTLLAFPPNFFAITMGLAGLAGVWQIAGRFYLWPMQISVVLYLMAAGVYLVLLIAFGAKLISSWRRVVADLTHPTSGPFNALLPITGMLLALGLEPVAHQLALKLFLVFLVATLLLGSWMLRRWFVVSRELDLFHSGYYLPTVAGGLIGSEGLARFGLIWAGWMCFGVGLITWLFLGSIVYARLFTRTSLPQRLIPTMAIEMAPPALAGNAYLTLTSGRIDLFSAMLVGYTLLMILVQLFLLPSYRALPFGAGFWSFTFPSAAATAYILRWMHLAQLAGTALLGPALLTILTLLVGGIVLRSLVALGHGTFLPGMASS